MKRFIPTGISVLRGISAPLVLWSIMADHWLIALIIFSLMMPTDILDGFLSRLWEVCSKLGEMVDGIADGAIVLAFLGGIIVKGIIPLWFLILTVFVAAISGLGTFFLERGSKLQNLSARVVYYNANLMGGVALWLVAVRALPIWLIIGLIAAILTTGLLLRKTRIVQYLWSRWIEKLKGL